MISTTQYNSNSLKNFLVKLKPKENFNDISKKLEKITEEKEESFEITEPKNSSKFTLSQFRFTEKNLENSEKSNLQTKLITKLPALMEGWVRIKSAFLERNEQSPPLTVVTGQQKLDVDKDKNLVNTAFRDTPETQKLSLNKFYFYFRINKNYFYFTPSKESSSIVFFLKNDMIRSAANLNDEDFCMEIKTYPMGGINDPSFKICSTSQQAVNELSCYVNKAMKGEDGFEVCKKKLDLDLTVKAPKIVKRKINQPYIVIPLAQRMCNQNWNYYKNGVDWECLCKEGKEQSPIDLPKPNQAIKSIIKPFFQYDYFNDKDTKLKIEHFNNALNIQANTELLKIRGFGKVVTHDGTVYYATDIRFHTPSEHTIDGVRFPLEVSIIHDAKTKGDYGKKVIVSFLFVAKPGVYNKFIDSIEFFNLPNPFDKIRTLHNKLFIPDILSNIDEDSNVIMKNFSFYTYQGSITHPPCNENVIHYVASNPIEESVTAIDLFKEALRYPDFEDQSGNVVTAKDVPLTNYREVQPLNGRSVFYFDSTMFDTPSFSNSKEDKYNVKKNGHFEKQETEVTDYIYVEGSNVSSVPGAIVVSEEEANGKV
jgi:carbonic anhydrase